MEFLSTNEEDTVALAEKLAEDMCPGDVICLYGDLGTGKTVFARALIRALAGTPGLDVPSPTFTLVQSYNVSKGEVRHFDLYRIEGVDDVYELGLEDALSEGITLIEWPERLSDLVPEDRLDITLSPSSGNDQARRIVLTPHGVWKQRKLPHAF